MDSENISLYQAFYQTPPLWQGNYEGMVQFIFPPVDFNKLIPLPIPENLRLGHQLEFIFYQLILNSNIYEVLAYNLPVRKNKISFGEIDFILQNTDNKKLIHLELTYKFYIVLDDDQSQIDQQLIGPNFRDTFVQKKNKLKVHQLPLSRSIEGTASLLEKGIEAHKLSPQVCYKSQLFTPFYNKNLNITPFNHECIAGSWISSLDFASDEFKLCRYYNPSKLEWILPPHNNVEWCSYWTILNRISGQLAGKSAPLIWVKSSNNTLEKMFIVWRSP